MKKKAILDATVMLQFLIDEMNDYNRQVKNDFVDSFFKFDVIDTNALTVSIKKKAYKVVYIEKECIFTIHINDAEVTAIEGIDDVILFLLA